MRRWWGGLVLASSLAVLGAGNRAAAQLAFPVTRVPNDAMRIDGMLRDWSGVRFSPAGRGDDASFQWSVAVNDAGVFVGAQVRDERVVRTRGVELAQDAVVLTLSWGQGRDARSRELWLFPGVENRAAAVGAVGEPGGRPSEVSAVTVTELARRDGSGYDLEAFAPWSSVAGRQSWRDAQVKIRLQDVDREANGRVEDEVASGSLAPLQVLNEARATLQSFLADHDLSGVRPRASLRGDVAEDGRAEDVFVADRFLVVLGEGYLGGQRYAYMTLPVESGGDVLHAELVSDVTNDGKRDLVVRTRERAAGAILEQERFVTLAGETPRVVLAVEVRREAGGQRAEAHVAITQSRREPATVVVPQASGNLVGPVANEDGVEPLLLPNGPVRERRYRWNGDRLARVAETPSAPAQAGATTAATTSATGNAGAATDPPPPAQPQVVPESEIFAAFRRDAGVGASEAPRFTARGNVAEDARPESVVVFGRSVFVFGPGFRNGQGYARYDAPGTAASDLLDVRVADVNGDRTGELVARVVQRQGDVSREILLLVRAEGMRRLGAVEVARAQGPNRVENDVRFGARGLEIRAGTARGFTQDTWGFAPDAPASGPGAIEPLLLPWRDARVVTRFEADHFVRR